MDWWSRINWQSVDWITPAIHVYAVVVFILTVSVYVVHRSRLKDLARRVNAIGAQIEGGRPSSQTIRLDQLTGVILHLGDVVERKTNLDIAPVLGFLRREERQRGLLVVSNLVNITETMIELFPMLGIFGTVWAVSGINKEDFSSERLLFLFGTATGTTLWALLYVIVFRISYSAFVQSNVARLEEHVERFQDFLAILEKRSSAGDFATEGSADPWSPEKS